LFDVHGNLKPGSRTCRIQFLDDADYYNGRVTLTAEFAAHPKILTHNNYLIAATFRCG
jgi:hypothetical protein